MIGTIGFVVEGIAIIALILLSYRRRTQFATFDELLDQIMTTRPARICILTFWWWLGWHFFFAQTIDPAFVGH
jgi:multisubunit Na+/H+ antiporter MnhB subunit